MRFALIVVFALLCAVLPMSNAAKADECKFSESQFLDNAKTTGFKVWSANEKALSAIVTKVNEVRKARGASALDADTVLFGMFAHNGQLLAAVMFFKNKCAVPGASLILPANYWAQALSVLGLTDRDFSLLGES